MKVYLVLTKTTSILQYLFPALMILNISCSNNCNCETAYSLKEDGEILTKICNFIIENESNYKDLLPCELGIRKIEDDMLNNKPILSVFLTCCYLGDMAAIDKETNEVIGYWLGDK